MFYFEDTTTQQELDDQDDTLLILDGPVRRQYLDYHDKTVQKPMDNDSGFLERIRKLM